MRKAGKFQFELYPHGYVILICAFIILFRKQILVWGFK